MPNALAPVGRAPVTATFRTDAYDGPCRHHAIMASTAASSPSTCAATDPSGSLRTHPVTPSRSASCAAYHRKETPCTRPVTFTVTAFMDGSEDRARGVRRGLGVAGDQRLDPAYDGLGLRAGCPGELDRVTHQGGDRRTVESQARVGGEAVEEVVVAAPLTQVEGHRDGVLLDRLVGGLASHSRAHGRHQDLGGGQEGQVAVE